MKHRAPFPLAPLIALAFAASTAQLAAADQAAPPAPRPAWTTDYETARQQAAEAGRLLLLNFTGSDWCPPCRRLDASVFSTPEFVAFAAERLVCVYVDFPRRAQLPPEIREQNNALAAEFQVESYPTIWVLAPDGTRLGRLGSMEGGPKTFIRAIRRLERTGAAR
jgi:protein disulfide-isomerase